MKTLAIDLFCGLGGWTEGLLLEGYEVLGFDIEDHRYGDMRYPAKLVLQDIRTLNGAQFKDAALIVASPPCQKYSYMAMPWSKGKQLAREYADGTRSVDELNELFNAGFRIQREACEAANRFSGKVELTIQILWVTWLVIWNGFQNWRWSWNFRRERRFGKS